jgi:K+-sensing histidine kinase KdpD
VVTCEARPREQWNSRISHGRDERRDPDQLLADVQRQEARARRGRLRIFFGASAGVGKTYSMLEAARAALAGGADIVVGYVEPHGRAETERLLDGLPQLPFLQVRYRGIVRREFDLDAALKRAPAIVLVDELAHSNLTEGSRFRGTPSAGKTSRSCSTRASACGRRSTSSTSRA